MRILIIGVYYLPSPKSSAKLIHDLAVEFRRLGHEVFVLAPDAGLSADCEFSSENGIKVIRIRTGRIDGAPGIARGFNEMRLSRVLWRKAGRLLQNNRCDLVIWYSPSIFLGLLVKKLKKLFSCPSYLILRDIFPQWAVDTGVLKKGLVYRFFRRKEMEQYDAADVIGVQSPGNLDYFFKNGLEKKYRLEVLYNWTTLKEENIPYGNFRERLGLNGKVVFFYGGNIGVAQDIDNAVRLAESLMTEPVAHLLFIGDGSEAKRFKEIVERKKLTNITIHGAVDQRQYLAMLSEFDVGIILLDRKFKTPNFPGKMLGYMYYSMPILASINPGNDLKDILEKNRAGIVCVNGDDERFHASAVQLVRDGELRRRLGTNGRMLLEKVFSVSRTAEQILSHFKSNGCEDIGEVKGRTL